MKRGKHRQWAEKRDIVVVEESIIGFRVNKRGKKKEKRKKKKKNK